MEALANISWTLRLWKDSRAQDLLEYALLAGFVAMTAGATVGGVAENVTPMFSKVMSVVAAATNAGEQFAIPSGAPANTK